MKKYNLAIVGAGPAGLAMAYLVAQKGYSVIVLEKKPQVGALPIRCGEAVGPVTYWPDAIPMDKSFIVAPITKVTVVTPNLTNYNLVRSDLGWSIDRNLFENWLARKAKEKDVDIQTNSYVTNASYSDTVWNIECNLTTGTKIIKADFLVGADGVESRVGLWTGITKKNQIKDICTTAQIRIDSAKYPHDTLHFFVGPKFIKNGYAWVFPSSDGLLNIGLGCIATVNKKERMDVKLNNFLEQIGLNKVLPKNMIFGAIPIAGLQKKLTGNNSLVVGDCAGMVFPLSCGGILNALHGAVFASKAVCEFFDGNKFALKNYEKESAKFFKWSFKKEFWARKLLFSCTDAEINSLLEKTKKSIKRDKKLLSEAYMAFGLIRAGIPLIIKKIFMSFFNKNNNK